MTALLADPVSKEHDTGPGHPERPERFDAALRGLRGLELMPVPPRAATEDEVAACHTREYIGKVKAEIAAGRPELSTGDTRVGPRSFEAALRCRRRRAERRGPGALRQGAQRLLHRPPARPSRHAFARHGLLHLQQRGHRGTLRAAPPRRGARADCRLGRASRQRHAGDLLPRSLGFLLQHAPVAVVPVHRLRRRDRGGPGRGRPR